MSLNKYTYATTCRLPIDLSLSENPLGPSPRVLKAMIEALEAIHEYPHDEQTLISLIAKHHQIDENTILLGAGANELLEEVLKNFALGRRIISPSATFPETVACMKALQGSVDSVALQENMQLDLDRLLQAIKPDSALISICNPNNPTGIWTNQNDLVRLAECSPIPLLISEAGADFVKKTIIHPGMPSNIIVVRSFSKGYGLAGLRIGYLVASPEIIAKMKMNSRSYRINTLGISAAIAALEDQEYLEQSIHYLLEEKEWLMDQMETLNYRVIPSHGQSFIAEVPEKFESAAHFCEIARSYGVGVIDCALYPSLERFIRISPRKRNINKKFVQTIKKIMEK